MADKNQKVIIDGIIVGGNSTSSIKIFIIKKKYIRIITNSRSRDSCRDLFKKRNILPLCSLYIGVYTHYVIIRSE